MLYFMSSFIFQKDKLKCFAVPTEDGPFCTSSNNIAGSNNVLYPINVEQIENEFINKNSDKRAKYAVKYGDFLTNCELMELSDAKLQFEQEPENQTTLCPQSIDRKKSISKTQSRQPVIKVQFESELELTDKQYFIDIDPKETITNDIINENAPGCIQHVVSTTPDQITISYENLSVAPDKPYNFQQKSKVKILSEEPYTKPLPEAPTLIPIPPTYLLHVPERKNKGVKVESDNNSDVYNLEPQNNFVQSEVCNQNTAVGAQDDENNLINSSHLLTSFNKDKDNLVPTHNTTRSKRLSDERVAVIQEKRKFNKKLRDIITDSLNLLEDPVEQRVVRPEHEIRYEPELTVVQKQMYKLFETRMNRMEENLLQKIDSNKHIMLEMKKQMRDIKKVTGKCQSCTQTDVTSELQKKKNLFHDISKYLTADAKSLVYEELFINEHVLPKTRKSPTKKLNKRRKI